MQLSPEECYVQPVLQELGQQPLAVTGLQYTLQGIQGVMRHSVLWEDWQKRPSDNQIFSGEVFMSPHPCLLYHQQRHLCLLTSSNLHEISSNLLLKCVLDCTYPPSLNSYIILTFSPYFFVVISKSQFSHAIIFILPQITLNSQVSGAFFFFSS